MTAPIPCQYGFHEWVQETPTRSQCRMCATWLEVNSVSDRNAKRRNRGTGSGPKDESAGPQDNAPTQSRNPV